MQGNETTSPRQQAETVREVCANLKSLDGSLMIDDTLGPYAPCVTAITTEKVGEYCDRIFSAYEREMAAKDAEIAKIVTLCNRLEAALKPVMYVHITEDDMTMDVFDSKMDAVQCVNVVRSVQAAMKEVKV